MNGRPKTKQLPVLLRRPLLWAAVCSVFLHLPVVALLSLQMVHTRPLPRESILLTVLQDSGAEQIAETEQLAVPMSPSAPDSGAESEQSELVRASFVNPAVSVNQSPAGNKTANLALVPAHNAGVQMLSDNPVLTTAAVDTREPLSPPVTPFADNTSPLVPPGIATTFRSLPVAERDANQMQVVMQNLIDRINEHVMESGLSAIAQLFPESLAPELLALPTADQVTAQVVPVDALTGLRRVDVTITRQINGRLYQVRARLQERALSHYAKFVNRWDDNVMLSNDYIDGRFHANSEVNFEVVTHARPQFNGEVTIAMRQPVAARLRQSTMFADGIRTGTGRIAMPRDSLPAHLPDAGATVLKLSSDARLEFRGSDGVLWTDLREKLQKQLLVPASGLVIIGDGRTRIELSGTVSGQVLVYSSRQLLITGNLVYADSTSDSSDTLALISDGSIEVAAASVTGTGDLQIHGALFARQRFSVRRFRDRHQGTLYVFGSLVAGSVSATEPRFHTHIRYDQRFDHGRPPAFPSAGVFDLLEWDQHWRAVNDADALLADVAGNAPIVEP
jgi:hypothetical protein